MTQDLIERLENGEVSRDLDEQVALVLGWTQRVVTGIGLNGRTPGRRMWFRPYPDNAYGSQKASVPRFSGPRSRAASIEALRAHREGEAR